MSKSESSMCRRQSRRVSTRGVKAELGGNMRTSVNLFRTLISVLFVIFTVAGQTHAQKAVTTAPKTPSPELVGALTKQLSVTPSQATGGAGALFGLAKSRLSAADFSKISAVVPGMSGF